MQRFQVPYNLAEVPEIQTFLQNGESNAVHVVSMMLTECPLLALRNIEHGGDPQALYRRSLVSRIVQVFFRDPISDQFHVRRW